MTSRRAAIILSLACIGQEAVAHAEPSKVQCIGANEDGQDLRRSGKLRDAVERFEACTIVSCPGPVRDDCKKQLDELRHEIPKLVIAVSDSSGIELKDARIKLDGAPLLSGRDGSALDVDPGKHALEVSADGYIAATKTLDLAVKSTSREVIVLQKVVGVAGPTTNRGETTIFGLEEKTQRPLSYGVGAGGVVALAVGISFGVLAKLTYDDALAKCRDRDPAHCNQDGLDGSSRADAQAVVSTIAFVAAAALLAGAVTLLVTLPKHRADGQILPSRAVADIGTIRW